MRQAGLFGELQAWVPRLRMTRVLESAVAVELADIGVHLSSVEFHCGAAEPTQPAVVIENHFAGSEMVGDGPEEPDDDWFGEERQEPVGPQQHRTGLLTMNRRTRSSSIFARKAVWHTTLGWTPRPAKS